MQHFPWPVAHIMQYIVGYGSNKPLRISENLWPLRIFPYINFLTDASAGIATFQVHSIENTGLETCFVHTPYSPTHTHKNE